MGDCWTFAPRERTEAQKRAEERLGPNLERLEQEMSEDPAPYGGEEADPAIDRSITGRLARLETGQRQWYTVGATGWRLSEYGKAQIRIEALRAAARVTSTLAINGETVVGGTPLALPRATLHFAEQFAAWLETGE